MALKIWLPLDGSLKNQGSSCPVVALVGSPTINDNGKIGKCYSFDGSDGISIAEQILPSQTPNWSFTCWFSLANITSSTAACFFSERTRANNSGYTIFIYPKTSSMLIDDGVRWTITPMTFSANTWYHLAVTRSTEGKKIYINGELKSSTSVIGNTTSVNTNGCLIGLAQSGTALETGNQGINGKLNDVRIYDHCLSTLEVKELSQGLVLHYKLDGDNSGIGENLILSSDYNNDPWLSSIVGYEIIDGIKAMKVSNKNLYFKTNKISAPLFPSMAFKENTQYTMSIDWRGNEDDNAKVLLYFVYTDGTSSKMESLGRGATYWAHRSLTSTSGKTVTRLSASYNTAGYVYIANFKVEEGTNETAYSPAPQDLNIDPNKIIDSSGYNHYGILVDGTKEIGQSPRYNGYINLQGNPSASNTTTGAQFIYSQFIMPQWEAMTVSWWANISEYNRGGILETTGNSSWDNIYQGTDHATTAIGNWDTTFRIYNGSTNVNLFTYIPKGDSIWHHHVITFDGENVKYYCDGNLIRTQTLTGTLPAIGGFKIGLGRAGGVYRQIRQKVSDFRFYVTALSEADILKLYQTPTEIDKNHNYHTMEVVENNSGGRELMAGLTWTDPYTKHDPVAYPHTIFNSKKEHRFEGVQKSAGSEYVKINPTGKTYYYDVEVSISAGNQTYIGFERYDAEKTPRSNYGVIYISQEKPSVDVSHKRYFGTVNLATVGTDNAPVDTISLRILSGWMGSDNDSTKTMIVHYLSLREVDGAITQSLIKKNGITFGDEFVEKDSNNTFFKNGFVSGSELIEK